VGARKANSRLHLGETAHLEVISGMLRVLKWLLILAVFTFLGVVGYAYLGDLSQPSTQTTKQVTIEVE